MQYHRGYADDVSFRALRGRCGRAYHATVLPLWRHGEHGVTNGVHGPAWVFGTVSGVCGWTKFSREMKKRTSLIISIATESALKKGASQTTKFKAAWRRGHQLCHSRSAFKTLPSSYGPLFWIPSIKINMILALNFSYIPPCFQSMLRTLNSELFLHSKIMRLPVMASTRQGLKHMWALLPSCWRERKIRPHAMMPCNMKGVIFGGFICQQ